MWNKKFDSRKSPERKIRVEYTLYIHTQGRPYIQHADPKIHSDLAAHWEEEEEEKCFCRRHVLFSRLSGSTARASKLYTVPAAMCPRLRRSTRVKILFPLDVSAAAAAAVSKKGEKGNLGRMWNVFSPLKRDAHARNSTSVCIIYIRMQRRFMRFLTG